MGSDLRGQESSEVEMRPLKEQRQSANSATSRRWRWGAGDDARRFGVPRGRIISKESLFADVESYISKVTTAGQLTLPKKIRKALGLGGQDYVEVALVGRTAVIRRLREDEEFLDAISRKVKKTGMTRARMRELLDEVKKDAWKKRYREAVR